MADYVPYEVIMERVKDDIDYIAEQAYERGKRDILEQLQTTPIDYVRCKNCKHCETTDNYNYCKAWQRETSIDGYCYKGDENES